MTARDIANARQRQASDPAVSAFVTASAGSGKTKLLTDRLLRLILGGTPPQRLLCLTFTKAAAAEMATRLNRRLGEWAVLPPAALDRQLADLLGRAPDEAERQRARDGFAQVLELPGGMRIATLHAFAQSLLRGFPLEAGLPPGFAVLEAMDADAQLAAAREAELPVTPALDVLAPLADAGRIAALARELRDAGPRLREAAAGGLDALLDRISGLLGVAPGEDAAAIAAAAAAPPQEQGLARCAAALLASGGKRDADIGAAIQAWLARPREQRIATLGDWEGAFITGKGSARAAFASKACGAMQATIQADCAAEADRLLDLRQRRDALALRDATHAALIFGTPVLRRFAEAKHGLGRLDYDDLIAGAEQLLRDPGAAWVLFKLDGGLDHVLLDEAQDSNPAQWGIADALTREFFAGQGANTNPRTVFAVGDVKQSIYGFQGADAAGLPRAQERFARLVGEARQRFEQVTVDVSFRSAPPVLALVDAVFAAGPARAGVVAEDAALRHQADRAGAAGLVELWPLQSAGEVEEPPAWDVPAQAVAESGPDARLAQALARRIAHMIAHESLPARTEHGADSPRRIRAGDILVLVRRRDRFLLQLVRALKEAQVPVGGVDRMVLIEQIAVQDVLATLDAILLPEDDLQLAAALKSPVFGLDEDALFALAHGREGTLHAALMAHRGAETPLGQAAGLLAALTRRAAHLPPAALIAELLSERGGRARLLARLGPDAADPLDELLSAALAHERAHPASLQHFLHWLRRAATEVKREPEGGTDRVRVMTVHGAKGLQAPIVILPDTCGGPPNKAGLRWTEDGLPLWAPRAEGFGAPPLTEAEEARRLREAAESNRLLYVALTRAEDRLLVAGWYRKKKAADCWYDKIAAGFDRLEAAQPAAFDPAAFGADAAGFETAIVKRLDSPQRDPRIADRRHDAAAAARPAPPWLGTAAPAATGGRFAAPSHLDEATPEAGAATPHAPGDPLGRRFRRGNLIHALLQHLPDHPPAAREAVARAFLARPGHGLDAAEGETALREALALLAQPELAAAFAPGSLAEAPIVGRIGGRLISGQADRLMIAPDHVLVVDYKTNRPPPATPAGVPPPYLRQMAAYRAVLRLAFPGRAVRCALVWTHGARLMRLDDALLDAHAPAA
jgi:ATP-dependent helicase/nuclease subunit A